MSEVTSIWDEVGTPSAALQYMVDGLRAVEKSKDFEIDMGWFYKPHSGGDVCFVCAATSALMQIEPLSKDNGRLWAPSELSAIEAQLPHRAGITNFELAMNSARLGELQSLFSSTGLLKHFDESFNRRWMLGDSDWQKQLPIIEDTIAELEALDL